MDYVGVFKNLQKALNFEEKDIAGVAVKFDDLKKDFNKTITTASALFAGIKRDDVERRQTKQLKG